jgi:hypothetical protein
VSEIPDDLDLTRIPELTIAQVRALQLVLDAAVKHEREACAKIVEEGYVGNRVETDFGDEIRKKAAAIRARS